MVVKLVLLVGPPLIRQSEGFLRSLAHMLEVDLPIPDHTTLSRRLQKLGDVDSAGSRRVGRSIC